MIHTRMYKDDFLALCNYVHDLGVADGVYEFIARDYWRISRDALARIALEALYVADIEDVNEKKRTEDFLEEIVFHCADEDDFTKEELESIVDGSRWETLSAK